MSPLFHTISFYVQTISLFVWMYECVCVCFCFFSVYNLVYTIIGPNSTIKTKSTSVDIIYFSLSHFLAFLRSRKRLLGHKKRLIIIEKLISRKRIFTWAIIISIERCFIELINTWKDLYIWKMERKTIPISYWKLQILEINRLICTEKIDMCQQHETETALTQI